MSDNRKIQRVVVLMAMQEEANELISSLQLVENNQLLSGELPFRCFVGMLDGLEISLVTSGIDHRHQVDNIGCEAATLMANESIIRLKPDLMISAGTAGGFSEIGAEIGTVYASKEHFVFHDRVVPLPGFRESAVGCFPALNIEQLITDLDIKSGVISTGSSLEKNNKDLLVIGQYQVVAKEMEAAAIAWVGMLYKIPVFAIKSITNLVDLENQSEKEFVKNFDYSVKQLSCSMNQVVHYLKNKSISDLSFR